MLSAQLLVKITIKEQQMARSLNGRTNLANQTVLFWIIKKLQRHSFKQSTITTSSITINESEPLKHSLI